MGQQGFRTLSGNPYVYQEIDSGRSVAYGLDASVNLLKINAQLVTGATPTGTAQITIDPAAAGNIIFTPNTTGRVVITSNLTVSTGTVIVAPLAVPGNTGTARLSPTGQLSRLNDPSVNGQLLISAVAGTPVWASLTAGAGITITPGVNSITLSAPGAGGFTWNSVPGNTIALVSDNGYMLNNAGLTTATLPLLAAAGDVIKVCGSGTGLFLIAQNAGQSIHLGNIASTVGVTGSLASIYQYDSVELLCTVANVAFVVISSIGNFNLI